jgi:hypothetical protein
VYQDSRIVPFETHRCRIVSQLSQCKWHWAKYSIKQGFKQSYAGTKYYKTCKKLLRKGNRADKKCAGFGQISLYIKYLIQKIYILILNSKFNSNCILECLEYLTLLTPCSAVFIQISNSFFNSTSYQTATNFLLKCRSSHRFDFRIGSVAQGKDSYRNGRNTHTDFSKIWNQ